MGQGKFNGQGAARGEGIHPGRVMAWFGEEIAAAGWRERKRRERRIQPSCGCADGDFSSNVSLELQSERLE